MFSLWPNKGTLFVLAGVALIMECWQWSTYLTYGDQPVVDPNKLNLRSGSKLRCKGGVTSSKLQ